MSNAIAAFTVGQRVRILGDGKGGWKPHTGKRGVIREIKDDPSCRWPYAVCTEDGVWLWLTEHEMTPVEGGTDGN